MDENAGELFEKSSPAGFGAEPQKDKLPFVVFEARTREEDVDDRDGDDAYGDAQCGHEGVGAAGDQFRAVASISAAMV